MKTLDVTNNQLTSLDVSSNVNLKELECAENELASLDVTACTELESLSCYENNIKGLGMKKLINSLPNRMGKSPKGKIWIKNSIVSVGDRNSATITDVNNAINKYWDVLWANGNDFTGGTLDPEYPITLKTQKSTGTELKLLIRWAETQAVSQDLLIGLEDITMTYESYYDAYTVTGKLTSQTVNVDGDVVYFDCREQEITSLDVSKATNLSRLICHTNLIETLNVSENLNLTSLDCQRNKLTSLDVSKNTKLDYVQCYINQLTSLTFCEGVANGYKDISCYRNHLNEAAMTALIEALPTTTRSNAELYLQNINESDEFNSNLTNEQITAAKSKGYTVKIQQSGASGWVEQ